MTDNETGTLGQTLRNRRLQRDLTLEEVTQQIRIQPRFLKALETEQWDLLPGRIFLEGFLRRYADFLGLDGTELLALLKERLGAVEKPSFTHPSPVMEAADTVSSAPLRLGFLLTALILVASGGFYFWRPNAGPPRSPSLPLNQVTEPDWTPRDSPAEGVETHGAAGTPLQGHNISVFAKESVWVRVRLDGAVRFEGTLAKGTIRTWPFDSQVSVRAGNRASVDTSVDGTPLPGSDDSSAGDWVWPPEESPPPDQTAPRRANFRR